MSNAELVARIMARVIEWPAEPGATVDGERLSGCWEWQGGKTKDGYGAIWDGRTMVYVHRAVYEYTFGPLEPGITIDHNCRIRRCCNPAHLEPVSRSENTRRARHPLYHEVFDATRGYATGEASK